MARRRRRRRWGLVELVPPRIDFRRAELRDALTNRMADDRGTWRGAGEEEDGGSWNSPLRGLTFGGRDALTNQMTDGPERRSSSFSLASFRVFGGLNGSF